jgi:hypothetical protein
MVSKSGACEKQKTSTIACSSVAARKNNFQRLVAALPLQDAVNHALLHVLFTKI